MTTTIPARDWELTCHECDGSGHVYVKHQVAERKTDIQEFKQECECCEGRGFVFAFQDIPGIEEYVKACRPAPAAGDALTGSAPEWATCESRGPWARNSLKAAIDLLREKETRARHAFTKDYMGLPARYIADAYGEAATVVERKLGAIAAQRKGGA